MSVPFSGDQTINTYTIGFNFSGQLLKDMANLGGGKFADVIVDEAHTLEAVAGDHLGIGITSGQGQYILNKLYNDRTNKGILVYRGEKRNLALPSMRPLHWAKSYFEKSYLRHFR